VDINQPDIQWESKKGEVKKNNQIKIGNSADGDRCRTTVSFDLHVVVVDAGRRLKYIHPSLYFSLPLPIASATPLLSPYTNAQLR
jgi:hypothetical protein